MTDRLEWTVVVLVGVVLGVLMAVVDAPDASYPFALVLFVGAIWLYQRATR